MKNNKYKILVLSDLKEKSVKALNYAAKLGKEINAEVEMLYVKAATELAQTENPLLAMRIFSEDCYKIDKEINSLVLPISKENNIDITPTFELGHVKNEIKKHLLNSKPDMIIMGQREQKTFNFLGDNITKLVNRNYEGVIFVATENAVLDANGNVSLNNLGLKDCINKFNIKAKTYNKQTL